MSASLSMTCQSPWQIGTLHILHYLTIKISHFNNGKFTYMDPMGTWILNMYNMNKWSIPPERLTEINLKMMVWNSLVQIGGQNSQGEIFSASSRCFFRGAHMSSPRGSRIRQRSPKRWIYRSGGPGRSRDRPLPQAADRIQEKPMTDSWDERYIYLSWMVNFYGKRYVNVGIYTSSKWIRHGKFASGPRSSWDTSENSLNFQTHWSDVMSSW